MQSPRRLRRGFTVVELMTVVLVVLILMTLVVPSIFASREASRQSVCRNKLKQLGLALHNYHDTHVTFAPGWVNHTPDPGPGPRLGWTAQLLPFVDQGPLFNELYPAMDARWVQKSKLVQTPLSVFRCPSDPTEALNSLRGGFATSNYVGNFGDVAPPRWLDGGLHEFWPGEASTPPKTNGIFWLNSNTRISKIVDGTSNVLLVGERGVSGGAGIWMGVRGNNFENDVVADCSPGNGINSGLGSFSSQHEGGANFLLCDGSVRFIAETVADGTADKPGLLQNLSNRQDGRSLNID